FVRFGWCTRTACGTRDRLALRNKSKLFRQDVKAAASASPTCGDGVDGQIAVGGSLWPNSTVHAADHATSPQISCIGIVEKTDVFTGQYTVWEHTMYNAHLRCPHLSIEEKENRVSYVLEKIALDGFEYKVITTLSAGQKKRLSIAEELLKQPALLLLDEPCMELDPIGAAEVVRILCEGGHTSLDELEGPINRRTKKTASSKGTVSMGGDIDEIADRDATESSGRSTEDQKVLTARGFRFSGYEDECEKAAPMNAMLERAGRERHVLELVEEAVEDGRAFGEPILGAFQNAKNAKITAARALSRRVTEGTSLVQGKASPVKGSASLEQLGNNAVVNKVPVGDGAAPVPTSASVPKPNRLERRLTTLAKSARLTAAKQSTKPGSKGSESSQLLEATTAIFANMYKKPAISEGEAGDDGALEEGEEEEAGDSGSGNLRARGVREIRNISCNIPAKVMSLLGQQYTADDGGEEDDMLGTTLADLQQARKMLVLELEEHQVGVGCCGGSNLPPWVQAKIRRDILMLDEILKMSPEEQDAIAKDPSLYSDKEDRGTTIIFSMSQPFSGAYAILPRVLFMAQGETVFYGRGEEVGAFLELTGIPPCPRSYGLAEYAVALIADKMTMKHVKNFYEHKYLLDMQATQQEGEDEQPKFLSLAKQQEALMFEEMHLEIDDLEEVRRLNQLIVAQGLGGVKTESALREMLLEEIAKRNRPSWWVQFTTLSKRVLIERFRHGTETKWQFWSVSLLLVMLASIYWQKVAQGGLGSQAVRTGTISLFLVFPALQEVTRYGFAFCTLGHAVTLREHQTKRLYGAFAAWLARRCGTVPLDFLMGPLYMGTILFVALGFGVANSNEDREFTKLEYVREPSYVVWKWLELLGILCLNQFAAQALGSFLGTLKPDNRRVGLFVSIIVFPFSTWSPVLAPGLQVPAWLSWIPYLSMFHWGGLLLALWAWRDVTLLDKNPSEEDMKRYPKNCFL
ncbi:unnamed protein product, partial [Amoebophrya sp. A25]